MLKVTQPFQCRRTRGKEISTEGWGKKEVELRRYKDALNSEDNSGFKEYNPSEQHHQIFLMRQYHTHSFGTSRPHHFFMLQKGNDILQVSFYCSLHALTTWNPMSKQGVYRLTILDRKALAYLNGPAMLNSLAWLPSPHQSSQISCRRHSLAPQIPLFIVSTPTILQETNIFTWDFILGSPWGGGVLPQALTLVSEASQGPNISFS